MVFDGGSMVFNRNLINYRGGIMGINTGICMGYIVGISMIVKPL
jgi:hypothetical protein